MKEFLFCGLLVVMIFCISAVIYHDAHSYPSTAATEMMRFQKMIGGVGLGAVTVPAWNFSDYDPRLQPAPMDVVYPVPGGYSYSPDRLAMVSWFQAGQCGFINRQNNSTK